MGIQNAGVPGNVRDMAVYDDGNGPALYAGGRFTVMGSGNFSQYGPNLAVFPPRGGVPLFSGSLGPNKSLRLTIEGNTGERYGIKRPPTWWIG
jgi:hypothetical protein